MIQTVCCALIQLVCSVQQVLVGMVQFANHVLIKSKVAKYVMIPLIIIMNRVALNAKLVIINQLEVVLSVEMLNLVVLSVMVPHVFNVKLGITYLF